MSHYQKFWKSVELHQNSMTMHYDVWKKMPQCYINENQVKQT